MPFQPESNASNAALAAATLPFCSAATVLTRVGRTALMLVTSKRSAAGADFAAATGLFTAGAFEPAAWDAVETVAVIDRTTTSRLVSFIGRAPSLASCARGT